VVAVFAITRQLGPKAFAIPGAPSPEPTRIVDPYIGALFGSALEVVSVHIAIPYGPLPRAFVIENDMDSLNRLVAVELIAKRT
jgi:hypothetical protein